MKMVGKINVGLAAAFILNGAVWASNVRPPAEDSATVASQDAAASQPYATVVARNIFGLVPVPPDAPPPPPPEDPPPKITANGITSIFGPLQAMFKVAMPPKDGQQAKELTYRLSEGMRQDDIEVTKIDEKAATITFNNHGVVQVIPLIAGQASSSDAPAAAAGQPGPSGIPGFPRLRNRPGGFPGLPPGGFGPGRPSLPGQNGNPAAMNNFNQNSASPSAGGGLNFNNPVSAQTSSSIPTQTLTREQSEFLIEAERARLQSSSRPEYSPGLLPPTSLTPQQGENQSGTDGQ